MIFGLGFHHNHTTVLNTHQNNWFYKVLDDQKLIKQSEYSYIINN